MPTRSPEVLAHAKGWWERDTALEKAFRVYSRTGYEDDDISFLIHREDSLLTGGPGRVGDRFDIHVVFLRNIPE